MAVGVGMINRIVEQPAVGSLGSVVKQVGFLKALRALPHGVWMEVTATYPRSVKRLSRCSIKQLSWCTEIISAFSGST
jgi:hypothetical protein